MVKFGKASAMEGLDIWVSVLLYRAVIQMVLLVGLESWTMSDEIMKVVKGPHMGFLRQIAGNRLGSMQMGRGIHRRQMKYNMRRGCSWWPST